MASLIPCRACKKEISKDAKTCPHCGHDRPEAQFGCVTVALITVAVLVWLFWSSAGC